MKTALRLAMGLGLVTAAGTGCVTMTETVRHYASADLRCPTESIRTHQLPHGVVRADGCGRRAYYMDNDAPFTTAATELQPGRRHLAMATHNARH